MIHYPCKKCGSSIPILKGSIVQCPYCGAKNLFMESVYTLKYYLSEILNLSSLKIEKLIKKKEIERRKLAIESYFYKFKSSFKEYRHLILTKLDTFDVNPIKLFFLIRASGNFEIIIEKFLLQYLEKSPTKKKFEDLRDQAYIINKSLLGLYYSYLAKKTTHLERSLNFYQNAKKNYQNIVDYCNITNLESKNSTLFQVGKFYSILVQFTTIIKNILNENPALYSQNLENLLKDLVKFKSPNILIYNLYKQIESIIQLERNTCILMENLRVNDQFLFTEPLNEENIITIGENLDKLNNVRNWIEDISEKYQKYQNGLLKLHSGRIIKYLSSYRTEFFNFKNRNAEKFDELLGKMINKALNSYNSETLEALDTLSGLLQRNIYSGNFIEKFRIGHDDLIKMDELVKNFVNNLFKKPLLRNLESEYYKKLISIISGRHSEFDKHILKFTIRMLKDFDELRNKKVLSIKEQRKKFISEIKPNLQKLVDLSFTLNEEILPYPLFIDINTPNHKLKVNEPEVLTLVIENPNLTEIKNVMIYFFIPESFHNKLRLTNIKKLKPNERRKIKIRINPRNSGDFLSMVMIEYQHSNKTFWMPSIKFKLEVEGVKKYSYLPPVINKDIFQNELQATRILKFIRDCI